MSASKFAAKQSKPLLKEGGIAPNNEATRNPIKKLRNEWIGCNSWGGHVCMVLFYVFVFAKIAWSIAVIAAPKAGWECFHQGLSDYASGSILMCFRTSAIVSLGFYCYAFLGGIKVWNVGIVFTINAAWSWVIFETNAPMLIDGSPNCDAEVGRLIALTWAFFWCSLMSVNFAFMEKLSTEW